MVSKITGSHTYQGDRQIRQMEKIIRGSKYPPNPFNKVIIIAVAHSKISFAK
jgi:hypothetical protein